MPLQIGIIKKTNQKITYSKTFPYMSRGILQKERQEAISERLLLADCLGDWVCTETLQQLIAQSGHITE